MRFSPNRPSAAATALPLLLVAAAVSSRAQAAAAAVPFCGCPASLCAATSPSKPPTCDFGSEAWWPNASSTASFNATPICDILEERGGAPQVVFAAGPGTCAELELPQCDAKVSPALVTGNFDVTKMIHNFDSAAPHLCHGKVDGTEHFAESSRHSFSMGCDGSRFQVNGGKANLSKTQVTYCEDPDLSNLPMLWSQSKGQTWTNVSATRRYACFELQASNATNASRPAAPGIVPYRVVLLSLGNGTPCLGKPDAGIFEIDFDFPGDTHHHRFRPEPIGIVAMVSFIFFAVYFRHLIHDARPKGRENNLEDDRTETSDSESEETSHQKRVLCRAEA
eukprot:CAMPEP_0203880572 /NCGR_PEP_ID=MMETSP0359-20131031/24959_1 /ASSEMBLY_ACC=CAM_ASM_000338 /TAXON_ID=268821 /ORGANISM="Scrippsiella Hangoei, Strain SHTV-5" /LENGTH=335 /DNA_ID=CAMNT_0050800219 /DNA_START=48 /DNA_END=1055 /DNA_ORIENTATION=+